MKAIEDSVIIEGLRNGDKNALKMAFDKYHDAMLITALRYLPADDAADIVQGVFIKFWRLNPVFKNNYGVGSYLMKMVRGECIDEIARKKNLTVRAGAYAYLQDVFVSPGDEVDYVAKERLDINLEAALSVLSPRYRQAIELVYFKKARHKTAALQMGISPNTVRNLIQRSLDILRKRLK